MSVLAFLYLWISLQYFMFYIYEHTTTVQLPVTVGSTAANENLLSASSQVVSGEEKDWGVCFNQSNKLLIWRCGHKPVDGDLLRKNSRSSLKHHQKEWNSIRGQEVFCVQTKAICKDLPTYFQASVSHSGPIFIFFFLRNRRS